MGGRTDGRTDNGRNGRSDAWQLDDWVDGRTLCGSDGRTFEQTCVPFRRDGRTDVRTDGRSDSRTEMRGRRSVHHAAGGRTDGTESVNRSNGGACVTDGGKDVQRMRTDGRTVGR